MPFPFLSCFLSYSTIASASLVGITHRLRFRFFRRTAAVAEKRAERAPERLEAAVTLGAVDTFATARRPQSLRQAAVHGLEFGDRDSFLREFLDEFYTEQDPDRRTAMLAEEPPMTDDARANAYYAAVAEHLVLKYHLRVAPWTQHPSRFLKRPFFPCGLESLKATLLMESPTAFRRRMIFVGADPLYRPRRDTPIFGK